MDFIENHEAVFVMAQEQRRVAQLLPIGSVFEVEIKRPALFADVQRERGLASLARADKSHRRLVTKRLKNAGLDMPLYHPCKLSI